MNSNVGFYLGILFASLLAPGCLQSTFAHNPATAPAFMDTPHAAFLWNTPYPNLIVEIDYEESYRVSEFAVNALVSALQNVTGKERITLLPFEKLPSYSSPYGQKEWTSEELDQLADSTLDSADPGEFSKGTSAVLHILLLQGSHAKHTSAIGLARGTTIFLFNGGAPVAEMPVAAPSLRYPTTRDLVERAVMIHEMGHVIGLVNYGIPMQRNHEDPDSPGHSSNTESVMHSHVDIIDARVGTIFSEMGPPFTFDADDMADIRAFKALAPRA